MCFDNVCYLGFSMIMMGIGLLIALCLIPKKVNELTELNHTKLAWCTTPYVDWCQILHR